MGRKGTRTHIERGISRDETGFAVRVSIGSGETRRSRERRFPPTVDLGYLRSQRAQLEADLRQQVDHAAGTAQVTRGTLAGDVPAYLKRVKAHLEKTTYRSRASELAAWCAELGERPRHLIRRSDLERIIGLWRESFSPKTILNRVRTLRHLYTLLDGPNAATPADGLSLPAIPKRRPRPVDRRTIRTVVARLIKQERKGRLRTAKTRARFLVLVTTGQRPSQMRRTTADDVDLERRIWWVPAGKGGEAIPLYLNTDMLVAWQLFIAAEAWGAFDIRSFARALRTSGWPAGVRVYSVRHTVGIALSEGGTDLGDIQAFMGHSRIQTTRDFYVPMLFSRLKIASEQLEDRVGMHQRGARFAGTLKYARVYRQKRAK